MHTLPWPFHPLPSVNVVDSLRQVTFGFGNKDTPKHINRGGNYLQQIHSHSQGFVVLYDFDARRGWLVDGATALLHLVYSYLEDFKTGPFGEHLVLDPKESLYEPVDRNHRHYAHKVLIHSSNTGLPVFVEKASDRKRVIPTGIRSSSRTDGTEEIVVSFKQIVEGMLHILDQIQDCQKDYARTLRFSTRDKLEGFDFMDAVKGSTLKLKATHLHGTGKGWESLARAVGATHLFGRKFGNLYQPSASKGNRLCKTWKTVPTGQDYLVVSTYDLAQIGSRWKSEWSERNGPIKLAENVYWYRHSSMFTHCKCTDGHGDPHCDRIQTLKSHKPFSMLPSHGYPGRFDQYLEGAVIFGRQQSSLSHRSSDQSLRNSHVNGSLKVPTVRKARPRATSDASSTTLLDSVSTDVQASASSSRSASAFTADDDEADEARRSKDRQPKHPSQPSGAPSTHKSRSKKEQGWHDAGDDAASAPYQAEELMNKFAQRRVKYKQQKEQEERAARRRRRREARDAF